MAQSQMAYDDYIIWVRQNHPVSKQADINVDLGTQAVRASRGGFDPVLYFEYDTKRFKGSNYFDKRETGLRVPTWGGVELKGTVNQSTGTLLNPEATLPEDGLVNLGATFNLGQNLIMDKRRLALRQAQIFSESTQAERIQILNDLFVEATEAYWIWAADYRNVKVLEDGVRLAEERFEMVKESYIQGDFPAIDTVEAYTQVMDRTYRLQSAQIAFFRSTQMLNTFLWDTEGDPLELLEGIFPEDVLVETEFQYSKDALKDYVFFHPSLRMTDFDIESLDMERRFKANQLLPMIKFDYNFLSENFRQYSRSDFFVDNYKAGVTFAMPLFLRRERGELGLAKAKINIKQYQRDLKLVQLQNKLEAEIYNFETVGSQLGVFNRNVVGLRKLLEGEMTRFEIGESSLFLVNAREVSLIAAQTTLNDLAAKRKAAYAKMLNAAGLGFEEVALTGN
jgi:outer membrane protein TolC